MKKIINNMTVYIQDDYETMSLLAAQMLAAQVMVKGDSILGLATGSTPEGMYRHLVAMYKKSNLDFSEVMTFNLDEYYPIKADNDQSYAFYMNKHLFSQVNIPKENTNLPDGTAKDVEAFCKTYDEAIKKAGNIDIQVLGIGGNGHIGFNEPDVHFETGTHLVTLDDQTVQANARFFESIDQVPRQAISMGIANIMHAKRILLLASGEAKREAIKKMIYGPVTPGHPASVLQLHNDVIIILDKEAAADL